MLHAVSRIVIGRQHAFPAVNKGNTSRAMRDWSIDIINKYLAAEDLVTCRVTEHKGRILLARRSFTQGDIIFQEKPLHIATEDKNNPAFKTLVRLQKKSPAEFHHAPLWYWAALSSLTTEQVGLGPPKGSLVTVTSEQQQRLLSLYHEKVSEPSAAAKQIAEAFRL
eukprot:5746667-Amphidinium_carterae.1